MKNEFALSTAFSLHNGVVVLEQGESHILFGLLNEENEELRERLCRCAIRENATCSFEKISGDDFNYLVGRRYGSESVKNENTWEEKNAGRRNRPFLNGESDLEEGGDECLRGGFQRGGGRKNTLFAGEGENQLEEKEKKAAILLLDTLIKEARKRGATDIHIEEKAVRFRINGILETVCALAEGKSSLLINRVKALSHLEILENRRSQDGQFVTGEENPLYVRVSCIPVVSEKGDSFGSQSAVLRLLDPLRCPPEIDSLGFDEETVKSLKKVVKKENGLILVCGPTGSGKTTTVCALLNYINAESQKGKKIITVEDPVEYLLDGVTQVKLDEGAGFTFDQTLAYLFRQDPDVLFIGEIRNPQTAKTALQASLTGHLVFATLHTSAVAEAVLRLLQLGGSEKEIQSALKAVVCQKLKFEGSSPKLFSEVRVYE